MRAWALAGAAVLLLGAAPPPAKTPPRQPSSAEIIAASPAGDWRTIDPENTVYLDLASGGRVIIELAPSFAPNHVANIKALARAHYFDGASIVRSQDNYVVQWSQTDEKKPLGAAHRAEKAEFDRPITRDLAFDRLPDVDSYAPQTGFSGGFAAARDPREGRAWLTHCYGVVGAGRDNDADSGGGAELYAVNGNAPRNLDRNVTVVGRVVQGMELLSVMPRGTGDLGFYEKPEQRIPIKAITVAADLPADQRLALQELRTDSATFARLIDVRRHRHDDWYKYSSGHTDVCAIRVPVRPAPK